jgi:hypothetical protein
MFEFRLLGSGEVSIKEDLMCGWERNQSSLSLKGSKMVIERLETEGCGVGPHPCPSGPRCCEGSAYL